MSTHVTRMEIGDAKHFTLESPKLLIGVEGAHAFCVTIFGGVEHLRADKGARSRLSGVVSAGQNVILGVGSVLGARVLVEEEIRSCPRVVTRLSIPRVFTTLSNSSALAPKAGKTLPRT